MTTALHPQRNGHAIVMYQCTDTLELGENWNTATSPNAIKLFAHTKLANNVEVCTTSNIFKKCNMDKTNVAFNIFNELRLEGQLCDVVIKVDGVEFKAHKNILCAFSSYFR